MNVFEVSIVTQQERKSNMRIRNGFIGSGFGEPVSLPPPPPFPFQEFPGIFPPPCGLKKGRKETKTLCSSRCAILSISQSTFFNY